MSVPVSTSESDLDAERSHLAESRAALGRMRARAQHLFHTGDTVAGDAYSAETLGKTLRRRVAELADDPNTPLFFGRLTFADRALDDDSGSDFHIGRRHVTDDAGEPMVLDWRAPLSRTFYQASARDPQGVTVRRRFGFQAGSLTGFEDEHLRPGRGARHGVADPDRRDRTPPGRADARHRRHHPARTGRVGTGGSRRDDLRAGRPRHRQDRGRPAPGRVPAVPAPRAAAPVGRARGRPEPGLPALHLGGAAGARRGRGGTVRCGRSVHHGRGARHRPPVALRRSSTTRAWPPCWPAPWPPGSASRSTASPCSDGSWRWRISAEALRRIVDDVRREHPPYAVGRERVQARTVAMLLRQAEARRGDSPPESWLRRMGRAAEVRAFLDQVWPAIDPGGAGLLAAVGRVRAGRRVGRGPDRPRSRRCWCGTVHLGRSRPRSGRPPTRSSSTRRPG